VLVAYRDEFRLRIPISSTSLAPRQNRPPRTKWTKEAVQELLSLVTEGETSCRTRRRFGRGSRKP
jgi:hypothetical protein